MPNQPAIRLRATAALKLASVSPEAFEQAAKMTRKVEQALKDLGYTEVHIEASVGNMRTPKEAKGKAPAAEPG